VWPHDNGIIALGFRRYGFAAEAARVARDISEAASYFVSYRLPELYAGIERRPGTFPVLYPQANVPQAWAAGSVFHLLQAMLGLRADAPAGRLYVAPELPRWLGISLHGLAVGRRVGLHFRPRPSGTRAGRRAEGTIDVREGRGVPGMLRLSAPVSERWEGALGVGAGVSSSELVGSPLGESFSRHGGGGNSGEG
jgi:hypothetical protein